MIKSFFLHHKWHLLLGVLIAGYLLLFLNNSLVRHWSLGSYYYDLGIMHQVVFNSAHGMLLQMTDPNTNLQISRFAIHFDPLMLIFVPFYWIFPHAEVLLIGQSLFLISGAIPVYLLVIFLFKKFKHFPPEILGIFFSFLYLNFFPMWQTNISDFHAVVLVTPLLLWAMYFIEIKKYAPAFIILFISLFGKENVALTVAMIGLYIAFIKKDRAIGLGIFGFCVLFFILVVGFIIPSHRMNLHFAEAYYSLNILTNFHRFFSAGSYEYIFNLIRPLGFLSLLAPIQLLIAAPEWLINLLSSNVNMRDLHYHYTALLTPFIVLTAIFGFHTLVTLVEKFIPKMNQAAVLWLLLFALFTCSIYTAKKDNLMKIYVLTQEDKKRISLVKELENRFKDDSHLISATGHLGPYFAGRTHFYNFLFDFAYQSFGFSDEDMQKNAAHYQDATYIIIQRSEIDNQIPLVSYYYKHLITNPHFEKVFDKMGFEIFHKIGTQSVSLSGI